jgi:acyl dehydratase
MEANKMGRYFEDFTEEEVIVHSLSKTIFESDVNLFSLLTMNSHPVHTNLVYASKEQHQKLLVPGTLVFSLVVGITVQDISGKAIANLGYTNVNHFAPVFIGDTIFARTEILSKRKSNSKPDRGIIVVKTTALNQYNKHVLEFERTILIKKAFR